MRLPNYHRLIPMAFFCLFLSIWGFAQTSSRDYTKNLKAKPGRVVMKAKKSTPAHKKRADVPVTAPTDCNNDVIAPEIHCPGGNCMPNARAAYLSTYFGEPWGYNNNIEAMDAVFGTGNWDYLQMENADVATLLSPAYKVIFLEGSNGGGFALEAFLAAHLQALENWVATGGALFLNCAPNEGYGPYSMNLGFGGVTLQNFQYIDEAIVQEPAHPIFSQPFAPASGPFYANSFLHATISGPVGQILITDPTGTAIGLSVKDFGVGKVYFGGMTLPYFHTPYPNGQYMRQNILADLNALCGEGLTVPADAGACVATIVDQSLDATATDDCALASLTHDFAGAPSNTTLSGAVLPVGITQVKWTAVDDAGNTGSCEVFLWVREEIAPAITCPDAIDLASEPENCGAIVDFTVAATDNCDPAPVITATLASGSFFSIGNTTVYATATDASGNAMTCTFEVTITPAHEVCNGLDDDCNGYIDDGAPGDNIFYADNDGDGYGDPNNFEVTCIASPGYVDNSLDCDDANYYIQPGMYEYCNGLDDNCDGNIDEGVAPTWYADEDGDGYGDPETAQTDCSQPAGYVDNGGDCDDTEAYIHPGALEDCTNLIDENCDGILGDNNFTIEETHTDVFCAGTPDGAISLSMTPAQNYPVILWSTGAYGTPTLNNLQHGTYRVTVTNECGTFKTKIIVIQPSASPALQVVMNGTDNICAGSGSGEITATAQGGCGNYTYVWNTGDTQPTLTGLSGGYYEVTVTDDCGCTQVGAFTINEPYPLGLYFGAIIPLLDGSYFVQVVPYGGAPAYQFRRSELPTGFTAWSNSNGFMSLTPGNYIFEVEDMSGCTAQAELSLEAFSPFTMDDQLTDILTDKLEQKQGGLPTSPHITGNLGTSIKLFPNPASGYFTVELPVLPTNNMILYATDAGGRVALQQQATTDSQLQTIDAGALSPGAYYMQVVLEGKVIAVEKFVIQ
ncbi:MAG: HYR domain-containing protein [Saprospiraceae bacterium]|nr:HYR domain-containing protein [Saprospiraceae bacterium]